MYDIIIVGAGASGLMCSIFAPKDAKKLIIEKTDKIAMKVFLSGGERCNFSNVFIDPQEDYFGSNKKFLYSVFSKFSNYDMINFLEDNGLKTKVEENGRALIASDKSTDMIDLLVDKAFANNTKLELNTELEDVYKENDVFILQTTKGVFHTKKLVVATGGRSFAHVGTTGYGFDLAKKFDLQVLDPYKGLCGMSTKMDISELSGSSILTVVSLWDKDKKLYSQAGPLLFTHWGVSGPCVFNSTLKLGEYLRNKGIKSAQEDEYIRENIKLCFDLDEDNATKKISGFFPLEDDIILEIQNIRGWKEAKVTGGGILVDELDSDFQCKKVSGLYFLGECLDITGKTGGYNLQFAWSSGYVCGKNL